MNKNKTFSPQPIQTSFPVFSPRTTDKAVPLPLTAQLIYRQNLTMNKSVPHASRQIFAWEFTGQFDEQAMRLTHADLTRDHDLFRLHLEDENGRGMIRPVPTPPFRLEALSAQDLQPTLKAWARQDIAEHEPSCSIRVFSTGNSKFVLVLGAGHELYDAHALTMLLRKLGRIYAQVLAGDRPAPEHRPQFLDFSAWLDASLRQGEYDKSKKYWQHLLQATRPVFTTPLAPDNALHPLALVQATRSLPPDLVANFEGMAKTTGCTTFEGYFTLFNLLLADISGKTDVLSAIAVSLRRVKEFSPIAGCLLNRLYLPVRVEKTDTFAEVAPRVHALLGKAKREILWPIWEDVDPSGQGYPGASFHYTADEVFPPLLFPGLEYLSFLPDSLEYIPMPLVVQVRKTQGETVLVGMSQAGFCAKDRLQDLLEHYARLLEASMNPSARRTQ